MDGQQTRPLVYAGSYTACCEGGWGEAPGGGSPQRDVFLESRAVLFFSTVLILAGVTCSCTAGVLFRF
jgi:hypothetical protein